MPQVSRARSSTRCAISPSTRRTRRQGIGRRLLEQLLQFAAGGAVCLEVRYDNEAAIALYRRVGFQKVGLRRGYSKGADAVTMRRDPQPRIGR